MADINEKIRKAVKNSMDQAGITQAELLRATGLNQSYFSAWMNGRGRSISIEKLASIAEGIGVKPSYLVAMAEKQE